MSSLIHKMLPALALTAMMSVAQAQTTTNQDHDAHHPDGAAATTQAQPAPAPAQATPTHPTPGAKPGMMMNMDRMRPMMGGMSCQQDGQSGMTGPGMTGPGMMESGMMSSMHRTMMGQQGAMGLPFEHVEGRIAFLKAELGITDAQAQPWNAFADALRASANAHRAVHERMTRGGMPSSWPDRLAFQQKALSARLDAVKALAAAAEPLYAVLTDGQKKLADTLLTGPMGAM
ncbi:Spy/CpxP family protein refolding chaperone [Azospirillum sp. RWY-5-1]|uniref:Spy/CpxP family protein refolding chaperone n=1 Tax=Azospirillum oleiclasticum TaxID=2735135 RepID=A0ABX2TG92_9PROT|nr:Spy/CpxP family protein refolding chaperone [Azospirillum oleiclasticum]NYZ14836.1 Spy/CpxP family protein refolding chaperone [Azospirillum oleiclasticum]NYZ22178.1 Spy/CpxP family protein refolding chaperone [Azospirillum oleiclasticum]